MNVVARGTTSWGEKRGERNKGVSEELRECNLILFPLRGHEGGNDSKRRTRDGDRKRINEMARGRSDGMLERQK
jgi:hypothetical protein